MVFVWMSSQQQPAATLSPAPAAAALAAAPVMSAFSASAPSLTAAATAPVPAPVRAPPGGAAAAVGQPMSARQRKQVYMHSALFDAAGAPPQSVYTVSRQNVMLGEVRQQYQPQRGPAAVGMPSAADLKATEIVGHGVITWDTKVPSGRRSSDDKFVQFADGGDHIRVVHANKDQELKSRHCSTMEWNDGRCEMTRADTRLQATRGSLGAVERKSFNLSSEVLGNERRTERSTKTASKEIRPLHLMNVNGVDSTLQRIPDDPLDASMGRTPMSARERKEHDFVASKTSQFSAGTKAFASPRHSPRSPRATSPMAQGQDAEAAERRRSERNYSDLFGSASPMSKHIVRRSAGEAPSPFGNAGAASPRGRQQQEDSALVYRPHCSALVRSPQSADPEEQVLPTTPRTRRVEPDEEVRRTLAEERCCWDVSTKAGMNAGLELSRRHRARALQKECPGPTEERARSASQRKRMNLGSRGLRCGMGAAPAQFEEEAASGPGPGRSYSASPGPTGGSLRILQRVAAHSARARKLSSLQSAGIF